MKIKEIKTLSGDRYNYVIITTDENIVGYGLEIEKGKNLYQIELENL